MTNTIAHTGTSAPLKKEELSFSLERKLFQVQPEWQSADDGKHYLIKEEKGQMLCRFFRSPLQISAASDKLQFSTKLKDQIGLSVLTHELQKRAVVHIREVNREHQQLPLCRMKPRVSYGE